MGPPMRLCPQYWAEHFTSLEVGMFSSPHFTDEETEAEGAQVTYPGAHPESRAQVAFQLRSVSPKRKAPFPGFAVHQDTRGEPQEVAPCWALPPTPSPTCPKRFAITGASRLRGPSPAPQLSLSQCCSSGL